MYYSTLELRLQLRCGLKPRVSSARHGKSPRPWRRVQSFNIADRRRLSIASYTCRLVRRAWPCSAPLLCARHCAKNPPRNTSVVRRRAMYRYGEHSHTKIAPLQPKIPYIKMDPLNPIRNGFANGGTPHSHFYAAWTSRHQSSTIPKALKIATLQKKNAPIPPHT